MKSLHHLAILTLWTIAVSVGAAETKTLASGTWEKKTQKASGTWKIIEADGKRTLQLDADFKTRKAPDLKVVFSPHTASAAKNGNALEGSRVIAPLKSAQGAQTYALPADLDLATYKSVLIHCEKYTKLWLAGALPTKP